LGINYPPDWGEGNIMSIWDGNEPPLRPGMTFHLVPGFGELGKYNLVISETVLVTGSGCEVVTNFPRDLFVSEVHEKRREGLPRDAPRHRAKGPGKERTVTYIVLGWFPKSERQK
jgi:hypothetical protein